MIVIKFGINKFGTTAEQYRISMDVLFPFCLKRVAFLWVIFAVTGVERGLLLTELLVGLPLFYFVMLD